METNLGSCSPSESQIGRDTFIDYVIGARLSFATVKKSGKECLPAILGALWFWPGNL